MPRPYKRGALAFGLMIALLVIAFVILLSRRGQNRPEPVQAPMHGQP